MLCAAETCSLYWICYNKSCVSTDCVLIIACLSLLCCVLLLYTALLTLHIKKNFRGTSFHATRVLCGNITKDHFAQQQTFVPHIVYAYTVGDTHQATWRVSEVSAQIKLLK